MAKIAAAGRIESCHVASGPGWTVDHVVCGCGPGDRPFDEQHDHVAIAIVTGGTFQYRGSGSNGREFMVPGSILLGSPGQAFACGHEHGVGDRCLSFRFTPEYFDQMTGGIRRSDGRVFRSLRLPTAAGLSALITETCAAAAGRVHVSWEELAQRVAARSLEVDRALELDRRPISAAATATITRVVRSMEAQPAEAWTLQRLAREARLSPFHFLRTFETLVGVTPHQYLRRARLRAAARLLLADPQTPIVNVAFDAGFGDVSNFNHAFRREMGVNPRGYRARLTPRPRHERRCSSATRSSSRS